MEPMAVEQLVSALWQLDGFVTVMRWPVTVDRGYSDIDVIGVNAKGQVRFAECKVADPARVVRIVKGEYARNFTKWLEEWIHTLDNIPKIFKRPERPGWLPLAGEINKFEFWFIANLWFGSKLDHDAAERNFKTRVREKVPSPLKRKSEGIIRSTRDVLLDVCEKVRKEVVEEEYGKRYGNPILDVFRELIRYTAPIPADGGRVGEMIKRETIERLMGVLQAKNCLSVEGGRGDSLKPKPRE